MQHKNVILLVEDDFLNRRITRKILQENNYNTLEAKNAKEALEILKKEHIDLVILDIHLGEDEQDGISLGQQINTEIQLPFIYLTAYENPEIIGMAIATTPYSYVTKPFKSIDLINAIEIAIRQSGRKNMQKIKVKDEEFQIDLMVEEINYILSEGNYLLFYTDTKTYKLRSTIKQILTELSSDQFIQVHRAYIINKLKIEKYNRKSLYIKNVEIPISKKYYSNNKILL